jgi:phage/plasmid-like protein (TIGR03299 family)
MSALEIGVKSTPTVPLADRAFVQSRPAPAWHNLATSIFQANGEKLYTKQMLEQAGLANWNVSTVPMAYPDGYFADKPEFWVTRDLADGRKHVLGSVGNRYHTYQNEQLFAFADEILAHTGSWESAGMFRKGRVVFGSMNIDHEFVIDPSGANDRVKSFLLMATSHDGSSSIRACATNVRVWCQNTFNQAFREAKSVYKVRHTATAEDRVAEAQATLGIAFANAEAFEAEANALFQTSITNAQFMDIVTALNPAPADKASKASVTKYDTKIDIIKGLYLSSPTNANITGTAWGAFNALTEFTDYFRAGRATTDSPDVSVNEAISASGFDDSVNAEKSRMLEVVKAVALV